MTTALRRFSPLTRVGGDFIWIVAGQATAAAGTLIGVKILTGTLSPASYGELALALTAVALAQQVAVSPLVAGVVRFYAPSQEAGALAPYLAAVWLLLRRSLVCIAVAAVGGVCVAVASGSVTWAWLVVGAAAVAILAGLGSALDAVQMSARHHAIVAWHHALVNWARPLLAIGVIGLFGVSSLAALWGYVLASVGVLGSQVLLFRCSFKLVEQPLWAAQVDRERRQMWMYSWPFATWGLLAWCQSVSDRYALEWFAGTEAVGLYFAASQVGFQPMVWGYMAITQLVSPILFRDAGSSRDSPRMKQAVRMNRGLCAASLGVTALAVLVAVVFGERLFTLLATSEYHRASEFVPWLVLAGGLYATGQVAAQTLMIATATSALILPKAFTGILGIALNVTGAAVNGIGGVVAANVAFGIIHLGWVASLGRQGNSRGLVEHAPGRRGETA